MRNMGSRGDRSLRSNRGAREGIATSPALRRAASISTWVQVTRRPNDMLDESHGVVGSIPERSVLGFDSTGIDDRGLYLLNGRICWTQSPAQ